MNVADGRCCLTNRDSRRLRRLTVLLAVLVLASAGTAVADLFPGITWEPRTVEQTLGDGRTVVEPITVYLTSSEALDDVTVAVVPELRGFVEVTPSRFPRVEAGVRTPITLTFRVPPSAIPGGYDGALRVLSGRRVISKPLPLTVSLDFADVEINEAVVTFGADAHDVVSGTSADGMTLFLNRTPSVARIVPGTVMVFPITEIFPGGAVREVLTVEPDGELVRVRTGAASLAQVFDHLDVGIVDQILAPESSGAAPSTGRLVDPGYEVSLETTLFDEDGDLTTTDDQVKARGAIRLEPSFDIEFRISQGTLERFVFEQETRVTSSLGIEASISLVNVEKKVALPTLKPNPIVIWAGYVPIVIRPELELALTLSGDVAIDVSTGISQESTIVLMSSYFDGEWDADSELSNSFSFHEPTATARATFTAAAGPELKLRIYELIAPTAGIEGFLRFDVVPTRCPDWWKLAGGLKAGLGFEMQVFAATVLDVRFDLIDREWPIVEAETCDSRDFCGDGVTTRDEVCDGTDLGGASCTSLGFGAGTLACEADCSDYVTSDCDTSGGGQGRAIYSEDFEVDPKWDSSEPQNLRWDSAGFFRVRVNDDGVPRWALSPIFERVENESLAVEFDVRPANMSWGTYPKIAFIDDTAGGLTDIAPASTILLDVHWDTPYGKTFFLGLNHQYQPQTPQWNASSWYRHRVTYDRNARTVEWVVIDLGSGAEFHRGEFSNIELESFNQIAVGYYGVPDYGSWGEMFVDNFAVDVIP